MDIIEFSRSRESNILSNALTLDLIEYRKYMKMAISSIVLIILLGRIPLALADKFFVETQPGPVIHTWNENGKLRKENLGGVVYGNAYKDVSHFLNCAGRFEVFARGQDNALWTRSHNKTWSNWRSLGGIFKNDVIIESSHCVLKVTISDWIRNRSTGKVRINSAYKTRSSNGVWSAWHQNPPIIFR